MAKEKLTIKEQLNKRQFKIPSGLTWTFYAALARSPFFGPKYHVQYLLLLSLSLSSLAIEKLHTSCVPLNM